jgi:hypothetical protein
MLPGFWLKRRIKERKTEVRARPRAPDPEEDRGMVYYLGLVAAAYVLMLGVGVLGLMMR